MIRQLLSLVAGAVLVGGGVVAVPATAHASALCRGSGCFGLDPRVEQCVADGYAVSTQYIKATHGINANDNTGFGYLHLMYSPSCNANWAEFDSYPSGYEFVLDAWNNSEGPATPEDWWYSSAGSEKVAWTNMVDGSGPADVGVCELTTSGATGGFAYLMQDGGDFYSCHDGGPQIVW